MIAKFNCTLCLDTFGGVDGDDNEAAKEEDWSIIFEVLRFIKYIGLGFRNLIKLRE